MKTDKEMAHEYVMLQLSKPQSILSGRSVDSVIRDAWEYIDAMNIEADKRKVVGLPEAIQDSGTIKCWSCDEYVKLSHRTQNDGHCPNCNAEIEL